MELRVMNDDKKALASEIVKKIPSLNALRILPKIVFFLSFAAAAAFVVLALVLPDACMMERNGEMVKDATRIIITAASIVVAGGVIFLIFDVVYGRVSIKNVFERGFETLNLDDDAIRYMFRTKAQKNENGRIIYIIPYDSIDSVEYNTYIHQCTIKGRFRPVTVEDATLEAVPTPDYSQPGELIIYDYFYPSLPDSLVEKSVYINFK
ncbi:MAG: hypothetical protein HUJ75_00975 [Parasporobacterium sp.]|nr:hypothetical protein [Parasporobacterium sp.]